MSLLRRLEVLSLLAIGMFPGCTKEVPAPSVEGPVIHSGNPPAPEPPRVYIDTTYQLPTGPRIQVHASDDLQKAIDNAGYNSVLVLDSGATWTGQFQVKPKPWNERDGWIYLISSNFLVQGGTSSDVPQPGTRVTPANAGQMAKIVTDRQGSAMLIERKGTTAPASHIRFVGIEMTSTSTVGADPGHTPWPVNGRTGALLSLTGAEHITVDRCYLHGMPDKDVQRAVIAVQGTKYIAVVDSDLTEIHDGVNEAQAFLVTSSEGPFKLTNNKLSATTEDVMFGGAGVNLPAPFNGYVPSDIEIRYNWFWKDEAWIPRTTGTKPTQWTEKNNLEFKTGQRIIVEGNTMQNAWWSGQYGSNILITPRSYQSGPNTVADDILVENNTLLNANWAFSIMGKDDLCRPPECTNQGESVRVRITHNMIKLRSISSPASYKPEGFSMGRAMQDYLINANTIVSMEDGEKPFAPVYFNQGKCPRVDSQPVNLWITENVMSQGITGDCGYTGQRALDMYMPDPPVNSERYLANTIH